MRQSAEDEALNADELQTHNLGALGEEHIAPTPEGGPKTLRSSQLVDWVVNGTRKSLQRVNPQIFGKAYNEGMKHRMKRNIDREHMRGIHHHYTLPSGFFAKARHFARRMFGGGMKLRMEEHYGTGESHESQQLHAGVNVVGPLPSERRALVQEFLENRGIPLPTAPTDIPPVLRGRRSLLIQQVYQITQAPAIVLEMMREQLKDGDDFVFSATRNNIFRPHPDPTVSHPLDYLIEAKKGEGETLEQQNSTAINDPRRLGTFLNGLKTSHVEIYDLMTKEILKDNQLDTLTNNIPALRLLRYIEKSLALGMTPDELMDNLKKAKEKIPKMTEKKKEAPKEGEKSEEQEKAEIEKLNEKVKKFSGTFNALSKNYGKAMTKKAEIDKAQNSINDAIRNRMGNSNALANALTNALTTKQEKFSMILDSIGDQEENLLVEASDLYETLKKKDESVALEKFAFFHEAFINNPPKKTDDTNLDGTVDKSFPQVIKDSFGAKGLQELKEAIKVNFQNKFEKKEKLDCFELHVALRELEAESKGTHTPGEQRMEAVAAVMMDEANGMLIDVDRSANREHQEWLASGRLTRAKKWLKAKMGMGGMQTGRNLIDHVSGFDREFAMFRGMKKDITEDELINLIDTHGGISDVKLFEFQKKLAEVFNGFEMLHHGGKVELFDLDAYDLQQLIHTIAKVRAVLWTRTGFESIADKDGSPAENTLLMLREKRKALWADIKGVTEKVSAKGAEWKTFFSREVLKKKFFDLLQGKWRDKKAKKMTAREFEHSLEQDGMLTVYDTFKNALMAKEVYDISAGVAERTGSVLATGGRGLAAGVGGVIGGTYRKILRPIGKRVKAAGIRVREGLRWSMGKAKYAAFPLVLAGGILGATWTWAKEPWNKTGSSGEHVETPAATHH